MVNPSPLAEFLARLQRAVADGTLVKLTLGRYQGPDVGLKKLLARPVQLREGRRLSVVFRYATRDITKNFIPEGGVQQLGNWLQTDFRAAYLATTGETAELSWPPGKEPRLTLRTTGDQAPPTLAHDRPKHYLVDPSTNPWLHALDVTTAAGKVRDGMEAKFRQINKFVEILRALVAELPPANGRVLRLVDMGCGKGYLTFAACSDLQRAGWQLDVRGIEARPELVDHGNRVARELGFTALRFECGTIADTVLEQVDIVLALHACDTATDDALAKGVQAGAALIVAAPCCHQELRPQLAPPPALASVLKHGILRERQAELLTDALRAALLEWAGYETKVFEFIATEHTAKNLMIAAVRRTPSAGRATWEAKVRDLATFGGIQHQRLATQLGFRLPPPTAPGAG